MPIVGCPAKGISALDVKISTTNSFGFASGDTGRWRKTTSERLNSLAIRSFWTWERVVRVGGRITARALPRYRVRVKTSRFVNGICISDLMKGGREVPRAVRLKKHERLRLLTPTWDIAFER